MATSWHFEAIGTRWAIDLYHELDPAEASRINKLVRDRIELFESTYSRFRKDSWLSKLSESSGTFPLPNDALPMIGLYEKMYRATGGLMTPLIGQVLSDAGYDANYSLTPSATINTAPAFDEVVSYDEHSITTTQPVRLDFGALGKGYLIDIVAELLLREGISTYCVDAGGDMRHSNGVTPLGVGLEDPEHADQVIGVLNLGNKSLAGSAGNRRTWSRFNHIINPKTLVSPDQILGVWAVADTTLLADALTTALYFSPAEELRKVYAFDYLIVYADRSVEGSLLESPDIELY